jgi:hypothetical protein
VVSRLRPQGGGEGTGGRAWEGGGGEGRNECVRVDAPQRPRGRIFTSADGKFCPRVKSSPWAKSSLWDKRRRSRTFG